MPRITMKMLEEDIRDYRGHIKQLQAEVHYLKEVNRLLRNNHFDPEPFCRMHEGAVTSIAHVVADLRDIINRAQLLRR